MKICEECGKELRLLEGFQHPTLGKKFLVCSPCFDQVSESVARWREFVLSNSFSNVTSSTRSQFEWKKIIPNIIKIKSTLNSKLIEKESLLRDEFK